MCMCADLPAFTCDSAVLIDCLVRLNFTDSYLTGKRVRKFPLVLYVACAEPVAGS